MSSSSSSPIITYSTHSYEEKLLDAVYDELSESFGVRGLTRDRLARAWGIANAKLLPLQMSKLSPFTCRQGDTVCEQDHSYHPATDLVLCTQNNVLVVTGVMRDGRLRPIDETRIEDAALIDTARKYGWRLF